MLHAETLGNKASIGTRVNKGSGLPVNDSDVKDNTGFKCFHYSGRQVQLRGVSLGHGCGRAGLF
jgi:hypothetical protein